MPGPWIDDATLLADVANSLGVDDPTGLPPRWSQIVRDANANAAADLTNILRNAGYTQAQIDTWDDRISYNRRLGVVYALTLGAPLSDVPMDKLETLDPRPMLKETPLTISIGGVPTAPVLNASQIGGIAFGRNESRDRLARVYAHNLDGGTGGLCDY